MEKTHPITEEQFMDPLSDGEPSPTAALPRPVSLSGQSTRPAPRAQTSIPTSCPSGPSADPEKAKKFLIQPRPKQGDVKELLESFRGSEITRLACKPGLPDLSPIPDDQDSLPEPSPRPHKRRRLPSLQPRVYTIRMLYNYDPVRPVPKGTPSQPPLDNHGVLAQGTKCEVTRLSTARISLSKRLKARRAKLSAVLSGTAPN